MGLPDPCETSASTEPLVPFSSTIPSITQWNRRRRYVLLRNKSKITTWRSPANNKLRENRWQVGWGRGNTPNKQSEGQKKKPRLLWSEMAIITVRRLQDIQVVCSLNGRHPPPRRCYPRMPGTLYIFYFAAPVHGWFSRAADVQSIQN